MEDPRVLCNSCRFQKPCTAYFKGGHGSMSCGDYEEQPEEEEGPTEFKRLSDDELRENMRISESLQNSDNLDEVVHAMLLALACHTEVALREVEAMRMEETRSY